jgi:hypothetical protein
MKDGADNVSSCRPTHEALWPSFVDGWPEARMEMPGLSGRILKGERGWVIFMAADRDVLIPMHHHGAQWGMILDGEMQLTFGDETKTYRRGEAHYIPAGVDHEALLRAGWRGMYVFARSAERETNAGGG